MSKTHYIAMPPDGAGKKFVVTQTIDTEFSGMAFDIPVGEHIAGNTSGYEGVVTKVDHHTPTTGVVTTTTSHDSAEGVTMFVAGEDLYSDGVKWAVVEGMPQMLHTNNTVIVGSTNPSYGQDVDNRGAAYTRFYEGSPQFDAFGKMRVSTPTTIAEYMHTIYDGGDDFEQITLGTGNHTWIPNEAGKRMQVGTDIGAECKITSKKYHRYSVGNSQFIEMTVRIGDSGKTNVVREWGYFDDMDGVYFQLTDNTLEVRLRSSTPDGISRKEIIPQSEWNGDRLNGEGFSNMAIDVTKVNIYWIDFQWLGAGQIRFGVFAPTGDRVVCHTIENANNRATTYMRTGSLPIRYDIENKGISASTSEMFIYSAAVKTEGVFRPHHHDFAAMVPNKSLPVGMPTVTPIMSMRMAQTFNGRDNRSYALPREISFKCTEPMHLVVLISPTLDAGTANWVEHDEESGVELERSATTYSGGHVVGMHYFDAGSHTYDVADHFDYVRSHYIRRGHTITDVDTFMTVAGRSTGTNPCSVEMAFSWAEVR